MDILIYILITFWQQCFVPRKLTFIFKYSNFLCMLVEIAFTCLSIKRIFITINRIVTSDTLIKIRQFLSLQKCVSHLSKICTEFLQISNFIEMKFQSKFLFFFFFFEGDKIYLLNFISTHTFLLLFFDYTLHITHLALLVILSLSIMCLNKTSESSEESKIIRLVPWLAISISSATADKQYLYRTSLFATYHHHAGSSWKLGGNQTISIQINIVVPLLPWNEKFSSMLYIVVIDIQNY